MKQQHPIDDVQPTSSDNRFGKSFPFESEDQQMSAMQTLAEHNANLRKSKLPQSNNWVMPKKEVFKSRYLSGRSLASSSEMHGPQKRAVTPSAITNIF